MEVRRPDILAKVQADFASRVDEALGLLDTLESRLHGFIGGGSDRLLRCVVFLAQGNLKELEQAIELCCLDYRDLIVAAEYEMGEGFDKDGLQKYIRVRDFSVPFH